MKRVAFSNLQMQDVNDTKIPKLISLVRKNTCCCSASLLIKLNFAIFIRRPNLIKFSYFKLKHSDIFW